MIAIRPLSSAEDPALPAVRGFFRDYAAWTGVNLSFQRLDEEISALPGDYSGATGRLLVCEKANRPIGCVGIRALSKGMCEMKRLYVMPTEQGQGAGTALVLAAIRAARDMGFLRLALDALPAMRMTIKICRELGFAEAPDCYPAPQEGAICLSLELQPWSGKAVREENLSHLLDFNRAWSRQMQTLDPDYFHKLSNIQEPHYLWIGCSDSRVPANQIVGLLPGEVFVHRNVANVVVHTDLNCLSVLQYAIDVLRVRHIMVVGHYGCGGVRAALDGDRVGLVDIWLRHVQDVREKHADLLDRLPESERHNCLCELNTLEQAVNVSQTGVIQDAWRRGQAVAIHAWIYSLQDGLVHDLGMTLHRPEDLLPRYRAALSVLPLRTDAAPEDSD